MSRFGWRVLVTVLVVVVVSANLAAGQSTSPPDDVVTEGGFIPPVDGVVIDPFRPPGQPWEAGNRGIEYATRPGTVAVASAAGVVDFAGSVAGDLHVTIRHGPDLVTTIAFVHDVLVGAGDRVQQGDPVAVLGPSAHVTARRDGVYIDPASLFSAAGFSAVRMRSVVRLVPHE